MGNLMMLDTFSDFIKHWDGTHESWLKYIQGYPELFEKIKQDYERYKMNWQEHLNLLNKRNVEELKLAHENLLHSLPEVEKIVAGIFGIKNEDYNIVIYVGLENGAGWVTEFRKKPSILFGLEAIAELKWYNELNGLISHEFGHLIHWLLRKEDIEKLEEEEEMIWLYTEGFAQRIEDLITGRPWHFENKGWFKWCVENEKLLKKEFLRRIREKEALNPFFGSWYQLFGKSFLGYYLGYRFILSLEEKLSLAEIAKLEKERIKKEILRFLKG